MRKTLTVLLLIPLSAAVAARQEVSFDHYQIIIDRAPFGSLPDKHAEAAAAAASNQPPKPSFADSLRVSSIIQDQVTGLKRVCFVDDQSKESFQFLLGDTNPPPIEGVQLLSVDYDKEEVILQKGEEKARVTLSTGKSQRYTGPTPPQGLPMVPPRGAAVVPNQDSYAQRREAMARRGNMRTLPPIPAQPEPVPQPVYTGEALQKHLSDYKMDVIRQGLPPLPIPLTREEDDQLVKEGVLPPQP